MSPKSNSLTDVERAILDRASQPPPPRRVEAEGAPAPPIAVDTEPVKETEADAVEERAAVNIDRTVEDLARQDGATFRSPGALFREFLTPYRQRGVVSAPIDTVELRRLLVFSPCCIG